MRVLSSRFSVLSSQFSALDSRFGIWISGMFIRHIFIYGIAVRWRALWFGTGKALTTEDTEDTGEISILGIGLIFGGSGSTRSADAGRGAGTTDALL